MDVGDIIRRDKRKGKKEFFWNKEMWIELNQFVLALGLVDDFLLKTEYEATIKSQEEYNNCHWYFLKKKKKLKREKDNAELIYFYLLDFLAKTGNFLESGVQFMGVKHYKKELTNKTK